MAAVGAEYGRFFCEWLVRGAAIVVLQSSVHGGSKWWGHEDAVLKKLAEERASVYHLQEEGLDNSK